MIVGFSLFAGSSATVCLQEWQAADKKRRSVSCAVYHAVLNGCFLFFKVRGMFICKLFICFVVIIGKFCRISIDLL